MTLNRAYLEITNCCNLRCSFCHGTKREAESLTPDEFDFLTDRLKGKVKFLYFHLLGEPLLHPNLPEFVTAAAGKGFRPVITTNGSLIGSRGFKLLETPLYKISISLHSPEANGTFATEEYLTSCAEFAREAGQRGIISVLRLWNLNGEDRGNPEILGRLHEFFPENWKDDRRGYKLSDGVYLEWGKRFQWPDISMPELGENFFCYGLRDHIGILVDGTVVPCCLDADGEIPLGNLFDFTLNEILDFPRAKAIYNGFTDHRAVEPLCRRCGYAAETKQYRVAKRQRDVCVEQKPE